MYRVVSTPMPNNVRVMPYGSGTNALWLSYVVPDVPTMITVAGVDWFDIPDACRRVDVKSFGVVFYIVLIRSDLRLEQFRVTTK